MLKLEKSIALHLELVQVNMSKLQELLNIYISTRSMTEKEFDKLKQKPMNGYG